LLEKDSAVDEEEMKFYYVACFGAKIAKTEMPEKRGLRRYEAETSFTHVSHEHRLALVATCERLHRKNGE